VTSTPCVRLQHRICRISTQVNVSSPVTMKPSRCSKPSGVWRHSVSASFETTIRSNSTTEVSEQAYTSRNSASLIDRAELSTQGKSERSISPNSANEEDRRELIARQHRALYGNEGPNYYDPNNFGADNHTPRPNNQAPGAPGSAIGGRGPSPMAYSGFGSNHEQKPTSTTESAQQYNTNDQNGAKGPSPKPHQSRSRANSTSSPASNPQNFSLFDNAQQSSRTSTSSPGGSPPRPVKSSTGPIGSSVAPIGTRPAQNQASNPALNKRSTTPLPSPLSYGFAPNEVTGTGNNNANERSTSAASNPPAGAKESNMSNMNWGSSSGVWGKNPLGVQTSVW
jgi:hypothetical protein